MSVLSWHPYPLEQKFHSTSVAPHPLPRFWDSLKANTILCNTPRHEFPINAKMPNVPTTREVVPGAHVKIVLKADQPTGRTVSGTVSQLLTRGNHPRGIKVRLTDGRVGRVQSIAGSSATGIVSTDFEASTETNHDALSSGRRRHHRADRQEQPPSLQPVGLDAYIKPAKKRGHERAKNTGDATGEGTADGGSSGGAGRPLPPDPEDPTCPICGDFRGDVAALTHHVQSHFDD